jgi:hypothetical protein
MHYIQTCTWGSGHTLVWGDSALSRRVPQLTILDRAFYSYRRASIGSSSEALRAG